MNLARNLIISVKNHRKEINERLKSYKERYRKNFCCHIDLVVLIDMNSGVN